MASLPSDRTKLALAQSNQNPLNVLGSSQNKNALTEAYDTIDALYNYAVGLISAGTLSKLGVINVKDYNASGLATTATGSITTGTKVLTLTTTPDFVAGQGIAIPGAGVAAATLITTVSSVNGLVVNVADSASTTVSSATVQHDDSAAFVAAYTAGAGKTVFIPDPISSYRISSKLTIPANTKLVGANKRSTKIQKAFNGDLMDLGNGATLENLYLEGDGANFTGKGILFTGTNGDQNISNCRVINFADNCLDFAVAAGSRISVINLEAWQTSGTTASGKYAIVISPTQQLSAVPRKFTMIETAGFCAFDFGGCNDTFVTNSFLGDLHYTADSRGVQISASRIANQAALAFNGHNNSIIGCDINPQITITSGADNNSIGPNSDNNLPIIDNSGNARNKIIHHAIVYTPVLTSGGTAPVLGNGSLSGVYTRQGATVTVSINFQLGSTTTLGTGGLSFSLPYTRASGDIVVCGGMLINRGGTLYTGVVQIAGAVATCQLYRDTTAAITFNSPATFASGDTIRLCFTYTN